MKWTDKKGKEWDIKPCPFCGRDPLLEGEGCWFEIKCRGGWDQCRMAPKINYHGYRERRHAIATWNRRAGGVTP